MDTFFAPAERLSIDEVFKQQDFIKSNQTLITILDGIPSIVLILNWQRQIVHLNKAANEKLKLNINTTTGKRLGEALKCIYSASNPNGCGTGIHCKYCGAVNTIIKSQKQCENQTDECRIILQNGELLISLDFQVTAQSANLGEKVFTIFTLEDISDKKRRRILEKSFFHDIINIVGSLQGIITFLSGNISKQEASKYVSIAYNSTNELIEEIKSHRLILSAENNDLQIHYEQVNTKEIIESVIDTASTFNMHYSTSITISPNFTIINFQVDKQILRRVLLNMVKNAIEASSKNGVITINADEKEPGLVEFSVHNLGHMTDEVKNQVFHRSFSTKGVDRGLGTYSMKLLIENYLKGSVYFTSTQEEGTTFYCAVPKEKPR
ncbi:MAG: ATP-binding protein [Tenuifilaceae bacterium]|nr:ATP-binding protein [Tenuifilaceae bacterium]